MDFVLNLTLLQILELINLNRGMNSIPEKVKFCTEDVLKKLENISCKRRHSPENLNLKKPKLSQRSKWSSSQIENIPYIPKVLQSSGTLPDHEDLQARVYELDNLLNRSKLIIDDLTEQNKDLRNKLSQSEELRKILQAQLVEYRGRIKILCRVKPAENKFIEYPDLELGQRMQTITISKGMPKTNFTFDRIFPETSTQVDIFGEIDPYIQTAIDGGKVCIFSYGQTGSGKTYTIEGADFLGHISSDSGVLPRASIKVYSEIQRQHLNNLSVHISCIEVYLDNITDLLQDSKSAGKKNFEQISWRKAENIEDLLGLIFAASEKRITRGTHHNSSSSRSHTVYQIRIEGIGHNGKEIKGKLSVIDLAGSERANTETFTDKTSNEIESMKKIHEEGKYINKSLSCLKRVFQSLSSKSTVAPYRENKLTRLLQDQLQYGEVVVIVTISPDNYNETKESLQFGSTVQLAKI